MKKIWLPVVTLFILFRISGVALPPNDKIWDIAPGEKYVWLAYGNGEVRAGYDLRGALRRYDRQTREWRTFTIQDIFGTDFNARVRAVETDGSSTVWVGLSPKGSDILPWACAVSHDNGDTWTSFSTTDGLSSNNVTCIEVDSVTKAIYVGHYFNIPGSISRSTNGGVSWSVLSPNDTDGVCAIQARGGTVWAGSYFYDSYGGGEILFKSTNSGDSWEYFDSSDTPSIHNNSDIDDICMVSPSEVHCAFYTEFSANSSSGGYVYTTDGGASWNTQDVERYDEYAQSITVDGGGRVWIALRWADSHSIYLTDDNGSSWQGFAYPSPLPYVDPFVIRYDSRADIVWAGFSNPSFNNFTTGWCWTSDGGVSWHTDPPPAMEFTAADPAGWNLYQ